MAGIYARHFAYDPATRPGFSLVYKSAVQQSSTDSNVQLDRSLFDQADLAIVCDAGANGSNPLIDTLYFDTDTTATDQKVEFIQAAAGLFAGNAECEVWYCHKGMDGWRELQQAHTIYLHARMNGNEGLNWGVAFFKGSDWRNGDPLIQTYGNTSNLSAAVHTWDDAEMSINQRDLMVQATYVYNASPSTNALGENLWGPTSFNLAGFEAAYGVGRHLRSASNVDFIAIATFRAAEPRLRVIGSSYTPAPAGSVAFKRDHQYALGPFKRLSRR
jgi:hypothetical protein